MAKLSFIINENNSLKKNIGDLENKIKKLKQDIKEKDEKYCIKKENNNLLLQIDNPLKVNEKQSKIIEQKPEKKNDNNEEKYEDTDKIYLDIKKKLPSISQEESVYLRLYYIYRRKCIEAGIKDYSVFSLIENHNPSKKICEIFHSCFKGIEEQKITLLVNKYKFRSCGQDDCLFK